MAHDVFVSYSAKDKPTADAVCATLESRGIRCWIAPRDILPGMDWGEAIIDAINSSRAIVLVFSSNANESRQIKREVERAVAKGIPIIPFRIEDVPLSKSLEYLISTPHWLDALTPPMERHVQYLAHTIHLLLNRDAQQLTPEEPYQQFYSEVVTPSAKTSSGAKIAVIAAIIGIPLLLGLFFLIYKLLVPDDTDSVSNVPAGGIEERPADISRGGVTQSSAVDPKLVGEWKTSAVIDKLPWNMTWKILPAGKYQFVGTAIDTGRFQGTFGRWNRRSNNNAQRDYGTYAFYNPNSLSMTGLGGTTVLTRTAGGNNGPSSRIDTQLIGTWQGDVVVKNVPLKFYLDIFPDSTYKTVIVSEDNGNFEGANGNWKQTSARGETAQGTYQFINQDAASFTGPLGTAVWNRSRG
jgi:hypothetical protein